MSLWVADFALQTVSIFLVALREVIPDALSMIGGNALNITGAILLLIGLERFLDRKGKHLQNWAMLALFAAVHAYFAIVNPVLKARNINLSLALLFVCAQCAWLLLRQAEPRFRKAAKYAGIVFGVYVLVSILRIVESSVTVTGNDYLHSGLFDALVLLTYQLLSISLTFALVLMVNRRLSWTLDEDIARRAQAEQELRRSEEKFSAAFQSIPDAITLTSIKEGIILDVNESFTRIVGFSREEAIGKTTIDLDLWGNSENRSSFVELLQSKGQVRDIEMEFRKKSGDLIAGSISAQILQLQQQVCVLSVIQDVTERKRIENSLRVSEASLRGAQALGHIGD